MRAVRAIAMTSSAETVTVSIDIAGGGMTPASGIRGQSAEDFSRLPWRRPSSAAVTASRDSRMMKMRAAVRGARPLVTRVVIDLAAPLHSGLRPAWPCERGARATGISGLPDHPIGLVSELPAAVPAGAPAAVHRPHCRQKRQFRRLRTCRARRRRRSQPRPCPPRPRKIPPLPKRSPAGAPAARPASSPPRPSTSAKDSEPICGRFRRRSTGCGCSSRFSPRSTPRSRRIPSASSWRSMNSRGYGRS